jgi:hypothetical protein
LGLTANLTCHPLLNFLKGVVVKEQRWDRITLLGLTADTEITEVHPPLGVAAGHLRSLRERGMDNGMDPSTFNRPHSGPRCSR